MRGKWLGWDDVRYDECVLAIWSSGCGGVKFIFTNLRSNVLA